MSDRYIKFVNTGIGEKLASLLGLPKPALLRRRSEDKPLSSCKVLLGYAGDAIGSSKATSSKATIRAAASNNDTLENLLAKLGVQVLVHESYSDQSQISKLKASKWTASKSRDNEQFDALIMDARALDDLSQAQGLHFFFNQTISRLAHCGRIIVLGTLPDQCENHQQSIAQRGLEGLTRSLAKECRHGSTAQLVYFDQGSDHSFASNFESTLRFLMSGASAFVSGQVLRITKTDSVFRQSIDWQTPLAGMNVLVTGAAQGIGLAIAQVMASQGAKVSCLDIPQNKSALDQVASDLGGEAIVLDISSEQAPEVLLEKAKQIGGWNCLVHNAGITRDKTMARMSPDAWSTVIDVNLAAQQRINDTLLNNDGFAMGSRIVCVSSISGIAGNRGQSNYAYSKAGVIGMVQAYSSICAANNMTINAVAPGFIETDMTASMPFSVREAGRRISSLSQGGLPIDVAESIALFANPASSALNGNILRVCGQSLLGA